MEKSTPVRKSHTSTADLLTWSENPPENSPAIGSAASSARSRQPSDGIQKVVFGGQVTDEEVESLNKRKPCSGYKLKEMTGSGIFVADGENGNLESDSASAIPNRRMYQQAVAGISQISFGEEDNVSPKKPVTIPEVAKQKELSGTLESEAEMKLKKQLSDAKTKELVGHDIFAPPPEIQPRPLAARALALRESITIGEPANNGDVSADEQAVKTAKRIPEKKLAELTGNDIFKGDTPPASAEKHLSSAKLREMSGSNIFADGKVESRDFYGGVRKPPGGESSIALV
ncbi:PREDICTED: uncharacterized protein LOC109221840 [Nicotiana attenuata]|uniref:DUF4057 domain-containing protein n=1 Tax=Nicotiana attenuata TaxID=49451 RepID=A0A1J6KIJ6_NICAT|nr:PREDICTED: uncharacterized protein LOC109221840 [Nicotiana attenuata]OIT19129.1 hypothetical protein A4A49_42318 [Nicotiana attenuata]